MNAPVMPVWRNRFLLVFSLLMLLLSASPNVLAQTGQGSLIGRVTDSSGAAIPQAVISLTSRETQVNVTVKTNGVGGYVITALNPGKYSLKVVKGGFETALVTDITISTSQQSTNDISLKVGKGDISVTVRAEASLLTKSESDVSTTVDHAIVLDLPYPERSSLEAALLAPGVNGDPLQPGGVSTENPNAFVSAVTPGASIAVGGGAPGSSSVYVDGSDVTQASYPRAGINLSGRVVSETSVIVTGLSAKYGRTSSGVIVQTSAGGTNQYHGALTWKHTDPYFNAYPLGGNAPSNQHENFYGAYFGGPVWLPKVYNGHDRTFFYVAVEPARLRTSLSQRGNFPTPDELAGKLNNSIQLLNTTILKNQGAAAALAAPRSFNTYFQTPRNLAGFPQGAIYNSTANYVPISGPLTDCDAAYIAANPGLTSCPNDVAPQLAQNPFAKYVMSLFPTPSNPGPYIKFDRPDGLWASDLNNAVYQRGVKNIDNRYSVRVDHQFGQNDQMFARYTDAPLQNFRFFAIDANNPLTQIPSDSAYSRDLAFQYTHVFSSALVGSVHYSFMRVRQNRLPPPSSQTKDYAGAYGLTPSVTGVGFPSLGSFNANGVNYTMQIGVATNTPPGIQIDQNFIGGTDFTWTKGHHLLQFGADLRWIQSNQYDLSGLQGGKYSFASNQTNNGSSGGLALSTFMLGIISSFSNTPQSVPAYYRWRYNAGYFQDNWRVKPNLTLNLGVRYEVETPRMEKFNNQAVVLLNQPNTLNGIATTSAFCFSGACNYGNKLFPMNWWGIEPRVGVSWSVTERSTLRASFGIMRLPLTGYENQPDPNFNVGSSSVGIQNGGQTANQIVDYMTNPVAPLSSSFTQLAGNRGPILFSTGIAPVYVQQTNAVPYTEVWSATYQYQIGSNTLIQATYQGLRGVHLIGAFSQPFNAPSISTINAAIQAKELLGGSVPNPYQIRATPTGPVLNETNLQGKNPYQNFFNQNLLELYPRRGMSSFNGLYLSVNQRVSRRLSFLATYVWQKSLDNVPEATAGTGGGFNVTAPQNPADMRSEWSVATFDQASRLKYGFTYALPFGRGAYFGNHGWLLNTLIGDIKFSGIGQLSDGFPNFVTLGTGGYFYSVTPGGTNGCTVSGTNHYCVQAALPAGYTLRPNRVPGVPLINPNWKKNPFNGTAPGGITPYLNAAAFTTPGSGGDPASGVAPTPAFGNTSRTLADARSPREALLDLRVAKAVRIHNRYRLEVYGIMSNAFNHPVYYGIGNHSTNTVATSAVTGQITPTAVSNFGTLTQSNTASLSRVIRVGAEFSF